MRVFLSRQPDDFCPQMKRLSTKKTMKITLKGQQGDTSFQILSNFRGSHYPLNPLRKRGNVVQGLPAVKLRHANWSGSARLDQSSRPG